MYLNCYSQRPSFQKEAAFGIGCLPLYQRHSEHGSKRVLFPIALQRSGDIIRPFGHQKPVSCFSCQAPTREGKKLLKSEGLQKGGWGSISCDVCVCICVCAIAQDSKPRGLETSG